jgi:hypothetical protein
MADMATTLYRALSRADDDDDDDKDFYNLFVSMGPLATMIFLVAFACPWLVIILAGVIFEVIFGPFYLMYLFLRTLFKYRLRALRRIARGLFGLAMMGVRLAMGIVKGVYGKVVG